MSYLCNKCLFVKIFVFSEINSLNTLLCNLPVCCRRFISRQLSPSSCSCRGPSCRGGSRQLPGQGAGLNSSRRPGHVISGYAAHVISSCLLLLLQLDGPDRGLIGSVPRWQLRRGHSCRHLRTRQLR